MKNVVVIERRADPLKKEKDDGYIEYKWKLVNISMKKKIKLVTQMNYRLNEGSGRSMYALGFMDDGKAIGISEPEMKETLENISDAVDSLDAKIDKVLLFNDNGRYWAKVFVSTDHICESVFLL